MEVGQEVYVLYGRGHESVKKTTKAKILKVGRKYFEIESNNGNNNTQYHLEQHQNCYYINTDNNCGYSSYVFYSEYEMLDYKNKLPFEQRMVKSFNELGYLSKVDLLKFLEKED